MDLEAWLNNPGHTQRLLAEKMSRLGYPITQGAISQWVMKNKVPADRCLQVEQATDGYVSRYVMRPDVFGSEPDRCPRCGRQKVDAETPQEAA